MKLFKYKKDISKSPNVFNRIIVVGQRYAMKGACPWWNIEFFCKSLPYQRTKNHRSLSSAIKEAERFSGIDFKDSIVLTMLHEQPEKMIPGWREALHYH